tara:strand:+ start:2527 stop:3144 length:618 start_codon:yes stop_codon:yes gene_type:complete
MNNYIKLIKKSKNFYKFHVYVIEYNYLYVPIFLITFIWIVFYSKMRYKIAKRVMIITSIYLFYNSISSVATIYYKVPNYCEYIPHPYDLWSLFRCYTYKDNFLLFSLIMFYTMNRYHTSNTIRIIFIILNLLNIYFSLVSEQIYLNQIIDIIVISFLMWSVYDNPNFFKKMKKNDRQKERRKMKKLRIQMQKTNLYKDEIEINDF